VTLEAFPDGLLQWTVRLAGLFWLVGAFMLFRQIRTEMALDSLTAKLEKTARDLERDALASGDLEKPVIRKTDAQKAADRWADRDDAARRGWIAGQAVVLAAAALAMILLHPFAVWMVALLVAGQGVYFFWREHVARRAPTPEAAAHARPSVSTINAGWVSLVIAMLVWSAAFRGLLN
jgi:Flp pilus assembly protein TadB